VGVNYWSAEKFPLNLGASRPRLQQPLGCVAHLYLDCIRAALVSWSYFTATIHKPTFATVCCSVDDRTSTDVTHVHVGVLRRYCFAVNGQTSVAEGAGPLSLHHLPERGLYATWDLRPRYTAYTILQWNCLRLLIWITTNSLRSVLIYKFIRYLRTFDLLSQRAGEVVGQSKKVRISDLY